MKQNSEIQKKSRPAAPFCISTRGGLARLNRFVVLLGITMALFGDLCGGALIYWNGNSADATTISGSDAAGIGSATFADPAVNQSGSGSSLISDGTTSGSSGYANASGSFNFQARTEVGTLSTSTSTYFSVTLTPNAGYAITLNSVSLGSRSSGTGPAEITIYSSIDNFSSAIGSVFVAPNSPWALSSIDFSGSSLTGAADTDVILRIYGSDGSSTSSTPNWRIDDISFTVALAAVPESDRVGLIVGGGLSGVCALHLWRHRRLRDSTVGV
jgi:hypothetical protein